jgi:hypothetical protein
VSPRLLRSLSIACKAIGHAFEREADELEQRAETRHVYKPVAGLKDVAAFTTASTLIRRLAERGAIEQCSRCGAIRTTSKPWRFWAPGAKAWTGRKPPCHEVAE